MRPKKTITIGVVAAIFVAFVVIGSDIKMPDLTPAPSVTARDIFWITGYGVSSTGRTYQATTAQILGVGYTTNSASGKGLTNLLISFGGVLSSATSTVSNENAVATFSAAGNAAIVTAAASIVQMTNYLSGQVYSNVFNRPLHITGNALITAAAVNGSAEMDLLVATNNAGPFYKVQMAGGATVIAVTVAGAVNWPMSGPVPPNWVFTFSNNVTGTGNSAVMAGTNTITIL